MNSIRSDFISKHSSILSDRIPVWLVAIAVFGIVVIWSFFMERRITYDDYVLFNPIYTFAVNDVISFPVHQQFDYMTAHPPTNYILKGFFIKQGIPIPYAVSLPAFILLLTIIVLVLKSRFSTVVKMGLLFGVVGGSMIIWRLIWDPGVGLGANRLDLEYTFALFAGLIALESGRINNWDLKRLAIGAFLLAYASGIHYPAIFSFMGILVYLGFALKANRSHGKRVAIVMLLGALVFAIPFFLLWVIPDFDNIIAWSKMNPDFIPVDIPMSALQAHTVIYQAIFNKMSEYIIAAILFFPLNIGIPVVLISTLILFVRKETRLMAIAALPTQLFLLLAIERIGDGANYYYFELILYLSAIVILVIVAIRFLVAKANRFWPKWNTLVNPLIAIGLVVLLIFGTGVQQAEFTTQPRPDEFTIARAAGNSIVGQDALVGAQIGRNYIHGESYWVNVNPYIIWNNYEFNTTSFFSKFDAIGIDSIQSDTANKANNKSLISYYIDQTLQLKGFYFSSRHNPVLSYMLFNTNQSTPIEGYALLKDWSVIHFEEKESGNYVFGTAVCDGAQYYPGANLIPSLFDNAYILPGAQTHLKVFVSTASEYYSHRSTMESKCSILNEIEMVGQKENYQDLVNVLHNDKPIQFYDSFEDMKKTALEKGIKFENLLGDPQFPIISDSDKPKIGHASPMQYQVTTIVTLSIVAVFLGLILWRWPQQIPRS